MEGLNLFAKEMAVAKNLKAYKLTCRDADHGGEVVFASTAKEARKRYSVENCDCEYIDRRVSREKIFDHLAPGPMTIEMYYSVPESWWSFPCGKCEQSLFSDAKPIICGGYVYCNIDCLMADRDRTSGYIAEGCKDRSFTDHLQAIDKWIEDNSDVVRVALREKMLS